MVSSLRNIVILISGNGSNMAAIVRTAQQERWPERLGAQVAAVVSNKADAGGLVFAKEQGIAFGSRQELIQNPKVIELYNQRIKHLIKDLPSYEQIKKFALLPEEFSTETGELTPSLKVRRKFVQEKYKDIISGLFEEDVPKATSMLKPERPA